MRITIAVFAAGVAVTVGQAVAADKVTLTVAAYTGVDSIVQDAIPGWTRSHPDVEIKLIARDFRTHQTAVATALASGTGLPDVIAVEFYFLSHLVETGGLEDLRKPPYEANRLRTRFLPYALPQATSDTGFIGAIPTDVGPGALFYRKDIIERAGVTEDDLTRSWSSYISAGKKIRERADAALLANASDMKDIVIRVGVQRNEGIYFDRNHRTLIDTPRFVRALTMAKAVRDAKLDARIVTWSPAWEDGLVRGTFATQMMGSWLSGRMAISAPASAGLWRAAPLPEGSLASFGGTFYAIPQKSSQKALAWEFIKYMTLDKEQQLRAFKNHDAFPALLATQSDPFFDRPVEFLGGQMARSLWRGLANRIPPIAVDRNDGLADQAVNAALAEVLDQGKDPAEALARGRKYVERLVWSQRSH